MGRNRTKKMRDSISHGRTLLKTKGIGFLNNKQHKCWTASDFLRKDGV